MKILHYSFLALATVSLSACEQMIDNMKTDIDNLRVVGVSPDAHSPSRSEMLLASPCPQVELVEDLSSLSDFTSESALLDKYLISRVDLHSAESTCKISSNSAIVDLKLAFKGTLGPRGRQKSTDKPFFAYPFFVAVTTPSGKIMAKEIFTAPMTYKPKEQTHIYRENLRQIIPILNKDVAHQYKILVGFQLSPEQLAYNREHMIPSDKAARIPAGAGMSRTKD